MNSYIFITNEGFTFLPDSSSIEPDINNLQVLGFAQGINDNEAFDNLIAENPWLKETKFANVQSIQLKHFAYQENMKLFSIH